jgi:hypothetical protein
MKVEVNWLWVVGVFAFCVFVGIIAGMGPAGAQAMATLIVGAGVVLIAWRQWETARTKLALDLFEKRFEIYDVIFRTVYKTSEDKTPTRDEVNRALYSSMFLFGPDIHESLCKIVGKTRSGAAVKHEEFEELEKEFARFMMFAKPM